MALKEARSFALICLFRIEELQSESNFSDMGQTLKLILGKKPHAPVLFLANRYLPTTKIGKMNFFLSSSEDQQKAGNLAVFSSIQKLINAHKQTMGKLNKEFANGDLKTKKVIQHEIDKLSYYETLEYNFQLHNFEYFDPKSHHSVNILRSRLSNFETDVRVEDLTFAYHSEPRFHDWKNHSVLGIRSLLLFTP